MQLTQKISISLDPSILGFIDRYAFEHAAKGRSAVVAKALQLLQITEEESLLAEAYAQSASQDKRVAAEFAAALSDGLLEGVNSQDPRLKTSHEAW